MFPIYIAWERNEVLVGNPIIIADVQAVEVLPESLPRKRI